MRHALFIAAIAVSAPVLAFSASKSTTAQPGADKDRLICRREVPIGSLIASRKVCLTKSQWEARARDGNEEARKMVYDNQGKPSGQ